MFEIGTFFQVFIVSFLKILFCDPLEPSLPAPPPPPLIQARLPSSLPAPPVLPRSVVPAAPNPPYLPPPPDPPSEPLQFMSPAPPPPPNATTVPKLESNPFWPAVASENGDSGESLPPSPPDPTVMAYLLLGFICMSCRWTTLPPPPPPPDRPPPPPPPPTISTSACLDPCVTSSCPDSVNTW